MIPSAPINDRYDTCRSRWLAASRGQARIRLRDSQPAALPIVSRNLQPARSPRRAHPGSTAKRSQQPLRPNPIKLAIGAPVRMAFHIRNCVGTRDDRSFAVQWLACALPCRRFAGALADVCARLGADVDRYSFTVRDLHPLLLAGLPAHSENLHNSGLTHRSKNTPYSMTSSASESRLSEILTPSDLAVFRLITNSYFVDCITGRSAGFSPLRMRPV